MRAETQLHMHPRSVEPRGAYPKQVHLPMGLFQPRTLRVEAEVKGGIDLLQLTGRLSFLGPTERIRV